MGRERSVDKGSHVVDGTHTEETSDRLPSRLGRPDKVLRLVGRDLVGAIGTFEGSDIQRCRVRDGLSGWSVSAGQVRDRNFLLVAEGLFQGTQFRRAGLGSIAIPVIVKYRAGLHGPVDQLRTLWIGQEGQDSLFSTGKTGRCIERRSEYVHVPAIDEVTVVPVTRDVTVGPDKLAVERLSRCDLLREPAHFQLDVGESDGVSDGAGCSTEVGVRWVSHVLRTGQPKIDTIPAVREVQHTLETVRAVGCVVEVSGGSTASQSRRVLTDILDPGTGRSVRLVADHHFQSLWEGLDGLRGGVPTEEVVESHRVSDGDIRVGTKAGVEPIQLRNPVI